VGCYYPGILLDRYRTIKEEGEVRSYILQEVERGIFIVFQVFIRFVDRVTSKQLSFGIIGILCVVTGFIYNNCERTAAREVQVYRTKNNTQVDQYLKNQSTRVKFNKVKESAFNSYFNQAICAGSFGVMASIELTKWIMSLSFDSLEGIVGHVFSVTSFITPFTITSLLFTLNKSLLRAAIAEVIGGSDKNDQSNNANDVEIYNDLFVLPYILRYRVF